MKPFLSRTITESSTARSNCWRIRLAAPVVVPFPPGLMKANEIVDLELLDQFFPGGRPTASGKHLKWNKLFIRVKPATDHLQAGAELTVLSPLRSSPPCHAQRRLTENSR